MLDFDCPLLGGLWNKLFLLRQAPVCTYLATWRPSVQVWTECAKSCLTWDQPLALIAPGLQETRSQPLLDGALPNCPHCSPGRLQAPLVSTCTRTGLGRGGVAVPTPAPQPSGSACLGALGSGRGTVVRTAWPSAWRPALQLPRRRGLTCEFRSRPWLAAQQEGVGQIRGPAPNLACWVLQGSEQLIMNLIKGEQEPQSDLGFSLTSLCSDGLALGGVGAVPNTPPVLGQLGSRVG